MTLQLVLATHNRHKVDELRRILAGTDIDVVIVGLESFDSVPDIAETGITFVENARLKAHAVAAATGQLSVADDSGLCVDVLGGMPGVLSARWSGRHGDDAANLDLVLAQLRDVPAEHRGAQFVCVAALATPDGRELVREGTVLGHITKQRRGSNGFGYDPIFIPEGQTRTTAQMDAAEKDAISHRGKAFRRLAAALPAFLG